jgi:hypothetical protein
MIETHRNKIEKRLSSFTYWLYSDNGLGIQKIVEKVLLPLESPIPESNKNKFIIGAQLLETNNKITNQQYESFVKNLEKRKLVHTDKQGNIDPEGEWNYVNKLNTNFYDLANLLTELLIRSYKNGSLVGKRIIEGLINIDSDERIKSMLMKEKHKLPQLFETYLKSPHELLNFTTNIKFTSSYGEKLESEVTNRLENLGYKILYSGGNGDYIDMCFSVDLIIEGNGIVRTVQVKTNQKQVDKFIKDCENGKNKSVDLLIYPHNTKYKIFMVKDKVTKEIDK